MTPAGSGSGSDHVLGPLLVLTGADATAGLEAQASQRRAGLAGQGHVRLPGRAVALAHIAGETGGGHVLPGVGAAAAAGHHVIDGELFAAEAAVLTDVAVALEDVATGEGQGLVGNPDVLTQSDDRGQEMVRTDRAAGIVFESFGFPLEQHHHGPAPGGDVQRFVGRIQNENVAHASPLDRRHAIGIPMRIMGFLPLPRP